MTSTSLTDSTATSHQTATETATQRAARLDPEIAKNNARVASFYAASRPAPAPKLDAPRSAEIQAIRTADPLRAALHPAEKAYGKTVDTAGNHIGVVHDLVLARNPQASAAQVNKDVLEFANVARDAGMSSNDITLLANVIRQIQRNPPTEQQVRNGKLDAIAEIRRRCSLGDHHTALGDYDQALADAAAISRREPLLAKLLNETGAGNDPRVIVKFAELGREARRRGEFAKK